MRAIAFLLSLLLVVRIFQCSYNSIALPLVRFGRSKLDTCKCLSWQLGLSLGYLYIASGAVLNLGVIISS